VISRLIKIDLGIYAEKNNICSRAFQLEQPFRAGALVLRGCMPADRGFAVGT